MSRRSDRVDRVRQCLVGAGVAIRWCQLEDNTATAAMAATALSCRVAEIAKSIVFRRQHDNYPIIAVLCGDNRVDVDKLADAAGGSVSKADAAFVNTYCGFEIGGVAPLAHEKLSLVLLDYRLRQFPTIWAAAGSAYVVFGIAPDDLAQAANAIFVDIAE